MYYISQEFRIKVVTLSTGGMLQNVLNQSQQGLGYRLLKGIVQRILTGVNTKCSNNPCW